MLAQEAAANGASFVDDYTLSIGHDACQVPCVRWVEPLVPSTARGAAAPQRRRDGGCGRGDPRRGAAPERLPADPGVYRLRPSSAAPAPSGRATSARAVARPAGRRPRGWRTRAARRTGRCAPRRLQVRRERVGVEASQLVGEQRGAEPVSLLVGVGPEGREVPVGRVLRVARPSIWLNPARRLGSQRHGRIRRIAGRNRSWSRMPSRHFPGGSQMAAEASPSVVYTSPAAPVRAVQDDLTEEHLAHNRAGRRAGRTTP